jgi:hypothetical protein
MSTTIKIFKQLDMLGTPIKLRMKRKEDYRSVLGGISTIIFFVISLVIIVSFGRELIYKENPKVTLSKAFQTGGRIKMTNNFPLVLNVIKRGGFTILDAEKIYSIKMVTFNVTGTSNGVPNIIKNPVNISICKEEDLNGRINELLSTMNPPTLSAFYCLKQNQNMEIFNNIGFSFFNYYALLINRCVNGTGIICKSNAEIDDIFSQSVFINIINPDYYFDSNSLEDPGQFYSKVFSFPISTSFYKRIYIYYKNIDYITDYGYLFPQLRNQSYYQFDNFKEDIFFSRNVAFSPETIAEISLTTSQIKDVYYRNYYKVQNLAADVSGILKVIMIVITLVIEFLNVNWIKNQVLNPIFVIGGGLEENIEETNKIKKDFKIIQGITNINYINNTNNKNLKSEIVQIHSQNLILNNLNSNININNLQENNNNISNYNKQLQNPSEKQKHSNKFENISKNKVTYKHILCRCLFKNRVYYNKLIKSSDKIINNFTDIRQIIKKVNEIELMKNIIFNDNQKKIFNFISLFPAENMDIESNYSKRILNSNLNNELIDNLNNNNLVTNYNIEFNQRLIDMSIKHFN